MMGCIGGGDAFSAATFECTHATPCLVSFWYKDSGGGAWLGFAGGSGSFPGPHTWTTAPSASYPGNIFKSSPDGEWRHISYQFPQAQGSRLHVHETNKISTNHVMLEAGGLDSSKCNQVYFDDIKVESILFAEDFEVGNLNRWRGKDEAAQPETATLESGPQCHGGSGSCLRFNGCIGGGDAFSLDTFSCTISAPCRVSFWYKAVGGSGTWLGFSSGFPGRHTWTSTSESSYPGTIMQTSKEDEEWRQHTYEFPSSDRVEHEHQGEDLPVGTNRIMLESANTDSCSSLIDDIVVTRAPPGPPPSCRAGTERDRTSDESIMLCRNVDRCDADKEKDCPAGYHLCTHKEWNFYNNGDWVGSTPSNSYDALGAIVCRKSMTSSAAFRIYGRGDQDNNCQPGSYRPTGGCDTYDYTNCAEHAEGLLSAACCVDSPLCGDTQVDSLEECDDGNRVNGDGCDNDCKTTVSDGVGASCG